MITNIILIISGLILLILVWLFFVTKQTRFSRIVDTFKHKEFDRDGRTYHLIESTQFDILTDEFETASEAWTAGVRQAHKMS